ncbi:MAG: Nucleotidyltransferase substrate binding protein like protein [Alphaproteobacteria bacterium ADurb.Bin438]|nr:MAG: Nucleotidyltransferase substrate binding protein like protein [Alphaproteobacteria bacterium ADurb.Bin438]
MDIDILKQALNTLKTSIEKLNANKDASITDMLEDSCVKRFEYTMELSWKMMKKFLKDEYGKPEKELTKNNIFRLMQGYGFISNWEAWSGYWEKRNDTSHEYDLKKSRELVDIIPSFINDTDELIKNLNQMLDNK